MMRGGSKGWISKYIRVGVKLHVMKQTGKEVKET